MFKICTAINKETGEIFKGEIDSELEHLEEYPFREATQEDIDAKQAKNEQENINKEAKTFLNQTDWQVIRHRDQLAMGIETSLTTEGFKELLQQRQEARERVVEVL